MRYVNGEPDGIPPGIGPLDAMPLVGRQEKRIARFQNSQLIPSCDPQSSASSQQHDKLVDILIIPTIRRRDMLPRNDPLDLHVRRLKQGFKEFVGKRAGQRCEEIGCHGVSHW